MRNYIYTRVSTEAQDYEQQLRTIDLFFERENIIPDGKFEEKEHGTVKSEYRELQNAINSCVAGDRIIVSEISRVTRLGEHEALKIELELFKKGASIFCIRENFTLGAAEKDPHKEMVQNLQRTIFVGNAKIERVNISSRTQSAIDVRKDLLKKQGFFISKTKRRVEKFGNPNFTDEIRWKGNRKSAEVRAERVKSNPAFIQAYRMASLLREKGMKNEIIADEMNKIGMRTQRGYLFIPASISQLIKQGDKMLKERTQ